MMPDRVSARDASPAIGGGWPAELALGFRSDARRTVLARRKRVGPLAVQRPFYPEGGVCHVYLLHPPGGVVGGDSLAIDVTLGPHAQALLTTPGATKFYRSAGAVALQTQRLRVEPGATLEWLPQENIFFPGAQAALHTCVDLCRDARVALWEIHCLGRPAVAETFDRGLVDSRLSIMRDRVPLLLERLRADPGNRTRRALLGGRSVVGTLIISHATDAELAACRRRLPSGEADDFGATLVEDLLVLRFLGHSTERARRLFTEVWQTVRPAALGRSPGVPRIWAT